MGPAGLEVRSARAADAAGVTRLLEVIYSEQSYFVGDAPAPASSLAARIAADDPTQSLYLVALCGREVAGWLELHRSAAWRLSHVAVLTLAVAPAQRRRGVGRSLMRRSYDWCRRVGVLKVSLNVRAGNAAAIALYESEGFVVEGRERGQVRLRPGRDEFEDNVIMARWLAGAPPGG
ncbi:MAG TPA: GNAT family N-acetyltransferase [Trueperaceae bacterium]